MVTIFKADPADTPSYIVAQALNRLQRRLTVDELAELAHSLHNAQGQSTTLLLAASAIVRAEERLTHNLPFSIADA